MEARSKLWCRKCRIKYINGGPAAYCLTCDDLLEPLPVPLAKVRHPRAELSEEAYLKAVLEPYTNEF